MRHRISVAVLATLATALFAACSGGGSNDVAGPENTVLVTLAGSEAGRVVDGGGSIDCPPTRGPLDWSPGLTVQLTATANSGSSFVSWSGDCTGADPNSCQFIVNGHMVVTATFSTP